jgi:hypothetical protein
MVLAKATADQGGKPVITVEGRKADVWREPDGTLDEDKLVSLLRPYVQGEPPLG